MMMTKRKKILLRILLTLALGCGVLCVALLAIIAPDQMRSVPEPVIPATRSSDADTPAGKEGGKHALNTDDPTSETYPIPLDILLQQDLRPCPDLSIFPEELRDLTAEWNQVVKDHIADLQAIRLRTGKMSYSDLKAPHWRTLAEVRDYVYRKKLRKVKEFHPPGLSKWREIRLRVVLEIAVAEQDWETASRMCQIIGDHRNGGGQRRNPDWWKYEVYYHRKGGFSGRLRLAERTLNMGIAKSPPKVREFLRYLDSKI